MTNHSPLEPQVSEETLNELQREFPRIYTALQFFAYSFSYVADNMISHERYDILQDLGIYRLIFKFVIRGVENLLREHHIYEPPVLLLQSISNKLLRQNTSDSEHDQISIALKEYDQEGFSYILHFKEILNDMAHRSPSEVEKYNAELGKFFDCVSCLARAILLLSLLIIMDHQDLNLKNQHVICTQLLFSGIGALLPSINLKLQEGSIYNYIINLAKTIGISVDLLNEIYNDRGNE